MLTINEANRLKLKLEDLTEKTKDKDYIIKTKLQQKDDQIKTINEQFSSMQSQIQTLITAIGNTRQPEKSTFAKQLFKIGMYNKD